ESDDAAARDGVLGDLAANLISLGAFAPARDALVVLTLTAQEAIRRLSAEINLFELAVLEGNEMAFEQHRRSLGRESMPPEFAAHYHLYAARGLLAFGRDSALVRQELTRARTINSEHDFHQLQFQVDELERSMEDGGKLEPAEPTGVEGVSEQFSEVAAALSELRELAEMVT